MSGKRHSWVKIKEHTYMCRQCSAWKVNVELGPGHWAQDWHLPDNSVQRLRYAPPCEVHKNTAERLRLLAEFLANQQPAPETDNAALEAQAEARLAAPDDDPELAPPPHTVYTGASS